MFALLQRLPVHIYSDRLRLKCTYIVSMCLKILLAVDTENEDEMVDACSSPRTFNTGDLVWGPIRGYPSWPGKIVHDSEVRGHHEPEDGKVRKHLLPLVTVVI